MPNEAKQRVDLTLLKIDIDICVIVSSLCTCVPLFISFHILMFCLCVFNVDGITEFMELLANPNCDVDEEDDKGMVKILLHIRPRLNNLEHHHLASTRVCLSFPNPTKI